jgi:hypothetical protein
MDVTYRSEAAPGGTNLDLVVTAGDAVVVLDGATPDPGVATGCAHDVFWFVRRLGARLAARLLDVDPAAHAPLTDVLAGAIGAVREDHGGRCDLTNPYSPSATVAMLRAIGARLDYAVLGDCALVLTMTDDTHRVLVDDRLDRLRLPDAAARARWRNRDGGFWVAGTAPQAADEALTGGMPARTVRAVALLTDGAYRLVSHFGHAWPELALLADEGPAALITRTRAAERRANGAFAGHKPHDDATVAVCRPTTADTEG